MQADSPLGRPLPNILVTGVPGCGKTTLTQLLTAQLNESINAKLGTSGIQYYKSLHVSELVTQYKLYSKFDEERNASIFDVDKVIDFLESIVPKGGCIVDFHSCDFFPERYFQIVVLLRCDNTILYKRLEARGYPVSKISENVDAELHDVVRDEAYESYNPGIILEAYNNSQGDIQDIMQQIFGALKKLEFLNASQ